MRMMNMQQSRVCNNIVACVVTYNRKNKLLKCVEALLKQSYHNFDILVVDNNSSDGTYEEIEKYVDCSAIRYVNTGINLGGAGGFNFAIKTVAKNYKYIWLMDDDTYPYPNALEALYTHAEKLNGIFGFLSSLAEWNDGNACIMNKQQVLDDIYQDVDALKKGMIGIKSASFVSLFIPSFEVKKYGLPIKEFFIWRDDEEYTRRLSEDKGYLVPESVVLHAMDVNDIVDIAFLDTSRVARYSFEIRNCVFMAKRMQNKKEIIRIYLSACKQILRVIFIAKNSKFKRILSIMNGVISSFSFNPSIEYID